MPPTLRRRPGAKSVIRSTALKPECCSTIASCALCAKKSDQVKPTGKVSRSGKVGVLCNTGKRKPSLHFCGHPHPVETIIDISLCNVQVHLRRKFQSRQAVTRAKSHRWRSSTSLIDASRIHNNAFNSILFPNTNTPHSHSASKDCLTIPNDTILQMKRLYRLARLRAEST